MNMGLLDADRSPKEKTFADLTPEERERYRKFWRKSRILEPLLGAQLFLLLLAYWIFSSLALKTPRLLVTAFFVVLAVSYVWLHNLECPRCSVKFYGGLIGGLIPTLSSWKCYGCGLSRDDLKYIAERTG